jgi:hypothetical protein
VLQDRKVLRVLAVLLAFTLQKMAQHLVFLGLLILGVRV